MASALRELSLVQLKGPLLSKQLDKSPALFFLTIKVRSPQQVLSPRGLPSKRKKKVLVTKPALFGTVVL